MTDVRERRVAIDGVQWLIRDVGSDTVHNRPTAVFVAGLGSGDYLLPHARLLAASRRVLLPDMPGFGHSRGPERYRSVTQFASALQSLVRHECGGPVDLVGNSFGTQIVLDAATASRDLARRLVLIGPTFDARARRYPQMIVRWLSIIPKEPPALGPSLARSYALCGIRTPLFALRAAMRDQPEDKIEALPHRILLVRGSKDRIAPRSWLEELQRRGQRVDIAEVGGVAHTVDFAAPAQAAALVSQFLDLDDAEAMPISDRVRGYG